MVIWINYTYRKYARIWSMNHMHIYTIKGLSYIHVYIINAKLWDALLRCYTFSYEVKVFRTPLNIGLPLVVLCFSVI